MADWGNVQQGLVSGFQVGQKVGGKLSGIGQALSKVVGAIQEKRVNTEALGQKQNLLGIAGITEGKIVQAQPNEQGAMNLQGIGWVKKAPSNEVEMLNRIMGGQGNNQVGSTQNLMGQDWKINKIDVGPATLERTLTPEENQQTLNKKIKETQATEYSKPYTDIEAGVISKGNLLVPQIDKLINLVEKNNVYEGISVPFGASRIAAFGEKGPWQSFKRGMTAGKGREAGILLKDIKVLAFGEGGKTLSETERMTALSNIDPSYKTEAQWVDGLKQAKALLQEKAKLMTKKNPFEKEKVQTEDFSNMSDEELRKIAAGE